MQGKKRLPVISAKGNEFWECSRCHELYPITGFYKDKKFANGHQSTCKDCRQNKKRKYRRDYWRKKNWKDGYPKSSRRCKYPVPMPLSPGKLKKLLLASSPPS